MAPTLERWFFDFLNSYLNATGKPTGKLQKIAKNGFLIS